MGCVCYWSIEIETVETPNGSLNPALDELGAVRVSQTEAAVEAEELENESLVTWFIGSLSQEMLGESINDF